ncbi:MULTISPECIES: hypothetical protein [unclassified Mycobacterium]|uniref:hypothetical protein n=1 Tax=unclassified Mycobacterium TaxID=2642494 RepID=UPI0007FC9594|nr:MULTISPECIES: hypothetical protein [unclassified Mycobacterium]OBG64757.1 hypothetical protein A5703_17315 [Mycobacterium sp. E188]OBH33330.1 hypothetical protein A5691_10315 [Mycobacterium sp. E183]
MRPTRHLHKRLGGAAAAATLFAVALFAVAPAGTAGAVYPGVPEWYSQAEEHLAHTTKFMQAAVDAIEANDINALRAACSAVHDEQAIGLQAHLPTPDPALTTALQKQINDFHTAMHMCMSLGPNSTPVDLDLADSYAHQAIEDLKTVNDILVEDLS